MKVGFTGARKGSTIEQWSALLTLLDSIPIEEAHHGNCVGWDAEVHDTLRRHFPSVRIVCHDPKDQGKDFADLSGDEHRPPKTHFARNRDIVDETDMLIVLPSSDAWMPRGGTWYTHDYAKNHGRGIVVVWPNGVIEAVVR